MTRQVYTSKFYRAIESGKLINVGEVIPAFDITEGGLVVTPTENNRRAEAMWKLAASMPAPSKNSLLVSHNPNIIDAFGKDWFEVKKDEASVFKPAGNGKAALVARVQASNWAAGPPNI